MKKVHILLLATLLFTGFSSVSGAHAMYGYSQSTYPDTAYGPATATYGPATAITKEHFCYNATAYGSGGSIDGVSCDAIIGRISVYPTYPLIYPVYYDYLTTPCSQYASYTYLNCGNATTNVNTPSIQDIPYLGSVPLGQIKYSEYSYSGYRY